MKKYDPKAVKLMLLFGILANIFFSIALFIGIKNIVLVRHIEYLKNKKK